MTDPRELQRLRGLLLDEVEEIRHLARQMAEGAGRAHREHESHCHRVAMSSVSGRRSAAHMESLQAGVNAHQEEDLTAQEGCAMSLHLTREQALAYVARFQAVAASEEAEQRRVPLELKLQQLAALMGSRSAFDWSVVEEEDEAVRSRWLRLKSLAGA